MLERGRFYPNEEIKNNAKPDHPTIVNVQEINQKVSDTAARTGTQPSGPLQNLIKC